MATGKRVRSSKLPPPPPRPRTTGGRTPGKRRQPRRGSTRRMLQLLVSAAVLVVVVTVKFTMPDVARQYGGDLLRLMGEDTDFVAAFSAAGRAIGGDDLAQAVNDACVAVFGGEKVTVSQQETDRNAVVYGDGTTPEIVNMLQQVLGFDYQKPVEGTVTSSFGYRDHPVAGTERFHYGLDIGCEKGEVIHAFADGTVTAVAESTELGKYVELTHQDGYTTLYAHCSRVNASSGQTVRMGDPIAEVGDTGDATGYHLHFELHRYNIYLNPIYYVVQ